MASATTTLISSAFLFLVLLLNPLFSEAHCDNILYSGEDLQTGDYLDISIYKFIMQKDCNLVLKNNTHFIWTTNTSGLARNCYCSLQKDGNLVIYSPNGRGLWASNTGREQGYYVLILQKDGNVVLYGGELWATGTNTYSLNTKRGGAGAMDVVYITNLSSSIIYTDGIDLAKNVTTESITTRAGRVA